MPSSTPPSLGPLSPVERERLGAACIAAIQRYAGSRRPDYFAAIEAGIEVYGTLRGAGAAPTDPGQAPSPTPPAA